MGKIALNEWLLSGWRADDLNDQEWAEAEWPELVESKTAAFGAAPQEISH